MSDQTRPTLNDLKVAQAALDQVEERWADYTGGNPNKYRSAINDRRRRVHELTLALKAQGDLPMTEHEQLCARLDQIAPNARSKDVVELEGKKYRRRYIPLLTSRSGKTVTLWSKTWDSEP